MSVILDRIVDSPILTQTFAGIETTRTAFVTGLSGDPAGKLYQAISCHGVPQLYEGHPIIPDIHAMKHNVRIGDVDKAEVVVTYGDISGRGDDDVSETGNPRIYAGSTAILQQVTEDIYGYDIEVGYDTTTADGDAYFDVQTVVVDVYLPETVLRFERREPKSPGFKSVFYTGTTNSTRWMGARSHKWLCTHIGGELSDNHEYWNVSYEFQYTPSYWAARVHYVDTDTGQPPNDLVEGVGKRWIQVYPERNFRALRLEKWVEAEPPKTGYGY